MQFYGQMYTMFKIGFTVLAAFCCVFLTACNDKQQGPIPFVNVDMYIGLNEPSYANLSTIGGWVYASGGSKGLIIFHKDVDEYVAYDRNCTYDAYSNCVLLKVLPSEQAAVDSCCGSKFSLFSNVITHGPASISMVQYQTELQGQVLHIFN